MKPGIYTVRGTIGPDKSEPVNVRVGSLAADPTLRAHYNSTGQHKHCAWFTFRDHDCAFVPRIHSPHPERIKPVKLPVDIQSTARSIAAAAFKAATEAAAADEQEAAVAERAAEQEGLSLDDIALGGMARRSMGVSQ